MDVLKRFSYHPIPPSESTKSPSDVSQRRSWVSNALCLALGAVIAITVMSVWTSAQWPTIKFKTRVQRQCGLTHQEAIEAGCIFDGMMNMWVHEECYDEELTKEFMEIQEWIYYEDYNATKPITQEQLSQSKIAYGTWEWHEAHCFYSMLKLQRAIKFGREIQLEVVSEEHTRHCKEVVNVTNHLYDKAQRGGDIFDTKGMGTILHPGFPLCIHSINLLPYAGVVLKDG